MRYDLNILNDYIDKKLITKQDHPTLPLSIYNYTRSCQYESKWDEITLNCRGLVLDRDGNVVAKPFDKFFNYEELKEIPNEPFEVFEKMDGSLGILFNYEGTWIMATRGSFFSEQAIRGMEMLKKYKYERLLPGFTYLFEIIYKENRIVVDYDYEDLVLLAVIDNQDGYELKMHDPKIHLEGIRFIHLYQNLGFKVVKKYDGIKDFKELKNKIGNNEEGYVIKFQSGMRMKIKGEEYLRLHRLLTNFSNVDIWEILKEGMSIDSLLDRVPDEFDAWVKKTVSDLKYYHYQISEQAGKLFDYKMYGKYNDKEPITDKKEFALWVQEQPKHLQPILFRMFDRKDYSAIIWKLLKPTNYEKPFRNKKED